MRILIVVLLLFCLISVTASLSAENRKDPRKLFEETCNECHSIEIPKEKRLSKAEWQDIVKRMKSNGLTISAEDEKIIVEYLSTTYGLR